MDIVALSIAKIFEQEARLGLFSNRYKPQKWVNVNDCQRLIDIIDEKNKLIAALTSATISDTATTKAIDGETN